MTAEVAAVYRLHEPASDRWFVWFGRSHARILADVGADQPVALIPVEGGSGWFESPGQPVGLVKETTGLRPILRYELADDRVLSERFPQELTVDEYEARTRTSDDLDDEKPAPEREWYRPVRGEPEPSTFEVVEAGRWVSLNGEPPPRDGLAWAASMPWSLMESSAVAHLVPGVLVGFRNRLKQAIEGQYGRAVDVYDHSGFSVSVRLMVAVAEPVWEKRGFDKRKREYHDKRITRRVEWKVADKVAGDSRAEAVVVWESLMADYLERVRQMATAAMCSHCDGTGVIAAPVAGVTTSAGF